ncbi:hypothetical protein ATN89_17485 [Comamonas thiooxydans]|uniref:hypothetical protein n=1 Tax=Comamonas thiooxydans TaxID=363952 RepID=UPI0007CC3A8B|nr:hypothetical protein [Comamonas thiooxydans]OAD82875.1 hypothetical protein ATN89_17485 [Comamonas thiooxydans]
MASLLYTTMRIDVFKKLGVSAYSEPIYAERPVKERCAPVRLRFKSMATTVRTDSSGTRGHAEEEVAEIRILVPPLSVVRIDDVIGMLETKVRVIGREPRFNVRGILDHYELTCDQKVPEQWG